MGQLSLRHSLQLQGDHGVDLGGAPGRYIACEVANECEHQGHRQECAWVGRGNAEEQRPQEAGEQIRSAESPWTRIPPAGQSLASGLAALLAP